MFQSHVLKVSYVVLALLTAAILWPSATTADPIFDAPTRLKPNYDDGDKKSDSGKKKRRSKHRHKRKEHRIRWGQKRNETDKEYDKRFARVLKRVQQDKKGDYSGGVFANRQGEHIQLWTYMGHPGCPFIIRTDIDKEFTANMAMYMEMLHREFSTAYKKLLGKPAQVKEPIEIITFADPGTYFRAGGMPGSGGQFNCAAHFARDRGYSWPSRHYRMMQFTDNIREFSKWPKGVLKHESCHMELYLRIGYKTEPRYGNIGFPIIPPIWWNEGQATVFEWWDFDKTVDENFKEIPNRGRYAPMIRRMYGSDYWKDFDYFWTMNRAKWDGGGRVYLNYCQGWSIVAYMCTGGAKGRADFRRIFDLTRRVGTNDPDISFADRKVEYSHAWAEVFPPEKQEALSNNWEAWVRENISADHKVPDEEYFLRLQGIDPSVKDHIKRFETPEEQKANRKWIEKEEKRRRKSKTVER